MLLETRAKVEESWIGWKEQSLEEDKSMRMREADRNLQILHLRLCLDDSMIASICNTVALKKRERGVGNTVCAVWFSSSS